MSKTNPKALPACPATIDSPNAIPRWTLTPAAAAFIRDRAKTLKTDPETILEDLVLVERRRVEGAI
jgi:hypothetical protein